jgi:aspartyl-tRNA(Asn)/glutamyl-tRNA(Gln) amidotransferase subunit C
MKLKKKDIEHIAKLARLDLTEAELKKYGSQLSDVLSYVEQLQEVNVDGVEPTAQVTGLENVFREDVAEEWDKNEREAALNQAPELEDGQIKVKRVLE